jgi:hypothetical protein
LTPATGARTTRFCRTQQRRSSCAGGNRSQPQDKAQGRPAISLARNALASTAARTPRIVTTRTPLFMRRDDVRRTLFSEKVKRIIFGGDLDDPNHAESAGEIRSCAQSILRFLRFRTARSPAQAVTDLPVGHTTTIHASQRWPWARSETSWLTHRRKRRLEMAFRASDHDACQNCRAGTRTCTRKSGMTIDLAMSALRSEADIRARLQRVCFVSILLQKSKIERP